MATSVLLVDDDDAFRSLAGRMLASLGLAVVAEAATVAAAVAVADALRPEAALVDVGLPDGDGLALARELAALPWRPRVLLTSSDPDAATPERARDAGAVGFLSKDDLPNPVLRALLVGE